MKGLKIDYDTADRITLCCLKDQLKYLEKEVRDHEKKGTYLHPEDYHKSKVELIPALRKIIAYYGG